MAKLKCAHERRVVVFKNAYDLTVIRHRNDGSACDSRFVSIDTVVYDPTVQSHNTPTGTRINALGPLVTIGKIDDAITRADKKVRQTKKVKRYAPRA
jgi:hypothetical protein